MTLMLRAVLLIGSVMAGVSVIHRIRKSRLQIEDALFWVCFSGALILIAVFPGLIYRLAIFSGTKSPANLLYLIIIAVLILKIFSMSLQISALNGKISKLVQDIALKEEAGREKAQEGKLHSEENYGELEETVSK
ncbi:MAG: DUF2304 domain-containing protein [Johnsonella sp.]|nr:DUF2304 domain-containing protein [Johnsonella sp.]